MRWLRAIAMGLTLAVVTTGCRCQVVVNFGESITATQTAPKTYDDVMNGNTNTLEVPLLGK